MGVSQWLDSVSTTSYTDTTPTPGVEYTYTVYSYSSTLGLSSDSNYGTENRSKSVTLSAPKTTISSAKNSKSKTATLTLKKVTGAKKYVIYRSTSKDGKYTKIGETSSTTYTDKKLTKGKTYYYKVKTISVNDGGIQLTSGYSAVKSVKIKK
jgi:fibronectin type 3 domain-containing protein